MNATQLLLIAQDDATLSAMRETATPLLGLLGLGPDALVTQLAADILSQSVKPTVGTIAWAKVDEGFSLGNLYELTATMQDACVPLALHDGHEDDLTPGRPLHDGAVALPWPSEPAEITAVLGALASQVETLVTLSREAELLRAHHHGMADQIGRIDEELRMAVKIQREFLPKVMPAFGPLKFEVIWRPAGYVSGDIYDVIRLDESHVGVFLADAVGHGVPAALMTIYIKQALRTKEITPGVGRGYRLLEPAETLTHLNRALVEQDGGSTCFATAVYAVIDTRSGQMTLSIAGHPTPLLLRSSGVTEPVNPEGAMLGVFDTDDFEQRVVTFGPGDRLLLYSDGFEMAYPDRAHDKSAASERYLEAFEVLRQGDPADAVQRFLTHLDTQTGSLNQPDDLTLMCVAVDAQAEFGEPADQADTSKPARAA